MYAAMFQSCECKASQNEDSSICELDRYLQERVCDQKRTDLISWWASNSRRYPKLAKVARDHLATPPSSALIPSERVFSTMGQIYDDKRCSLLDINAKKLCFLNYNLKLLNLDY